MRRLRIPPHPDPLPPLVRGERAGSGGILHAQQFVNFAHAIGMTTPKASCPAVATGADWCWQSGRHTLSLGQKPSRPSSATSTPPIYCCSGLALCANSCPMGRGLPAHALWAQPPTAEVARQIEPFRDYERRECLKHALHRRGHHFEVQLGGYSGCVRSRSQRLTVCWRRNSGRRVRVSIVIALV